MRVLFCYRSNNVDRQGGAALLMNDLVAAVRAQGVEVEVSYEQEPDPTGFDLVHVVNIWEPRGALTQMRHLRANGVPIVWNPIYTHWDEVAWAQLAVPAVYGSIPVSEREPYLRALAQGKVNLDNGVSKYLPNEIIPDFHAMVRELADAADHTLVFSNHEIQFLQKTIGIRQLRHSIMRSGFAREQFEQGSAEEFRAHAGISEEFVLCVGTPNGLKNQLLLLEALKGTGLTLCLIGRAHEPHYRQLLEQEGGQRLKMIDFIPRELVAGAYRAANVHASVSFAECCAQVNLEAAFCGCPIVVSNRSSEFEYFGDYAVYCDPSDVESIRAAVIEAWDGRTKEPYRWQTLSEKIGELSWDKAAEVVVSAYERTLAIRSQQRRVSARGAAGLAGGRAFIALAAAEELLARPELLERWAEGVSGSDPVTLVIATDGGEEEFLERLGPAAAAAGLDSADSAELLVISGDELALAAGADCLWGSTVASPSELPRFEQAEAVLALLNERRLVLWG